MRPEELLNPETLPEDLQWLAAEYRLQPNDPVFLLVAWHWIRAQQGEDTLKSALMELKAGADSRIASLIDAAETVSGVRDQLAAVQQALDQKPAALAQQLETELRRPVAAAMAQIQGIERSCQALLHATRSAQLRAHRQHTLAVLLVGMVIGGLAAVLVRLP